MESAKHNVRTVHSPREGTDMFRRFPNVDVVAIDAGFGDLECTALVRDIKAVNQKIRVVAFAPNVAARSPWADETVSSHDPAELLRLLQEMGGRTDIA